MPFNVAYVTGKYRSVATFDNERDASEWLRATQELKSLMAGFVEAQQEVSWGDERSAAFLMEWLQLFITYQNTWGSDMMAPDVLAAAQTNNNNGLPDHGKDPITIPSSVQGTIAGCSMVHE